MVQDCMNGNINPVLHTYDTKFPARDPSADITDREAVHRAPHQAQCSSSKSKAWRPSKRFEARGQGVSDTANALTPQVTHKRLRIMAEGQH